MIDKKCDRIVDVPVQLSVLDHRKTNYPAPVRLEKRRALPHAQPCLPTLQVLSKNSSSASRPPPAAAARTSLGSGPRHPVQHWDIFLDPSPSKSALASSPNKLDEIDHVDAGSPASTLICTCTGAKFEARTKTYLDQV